MSKQFEFEKTSIPSNYCMNLFDNYNMVWVDTRSADIFRVFFTTVADVLKIHQDKTKSRIGFAMKDDKGNFKFGAILNYRKPDTDEEDDTGNWYLEFTFDPSDMVDLEAEYDNFSEEFIVCSQEEANNIASARFQKPEYMYIMYNTLLDTITNFLDTNASETEEIEVTLRGVFTASVVVENGIKVMSIVPGEVIKQVIKADSIL